MQEEQVKLADRVVQLELREIKVLVVVHETPLLTENLLEDADGLLRPPPLPSVPS